MGIEHRIILAAWLLASAGATAAPPPLQLTILTEHAPPASMLENGKVTGSATDKVREVMARTGIAYRLDLQPWKRAYTAALQEPDTCAVSTTRMPARERLFKWIGPTATVNWMLLGRTGRPYAVKTLADARSLRIGTYNGDAIDTFLRDQGFQVDSVQDDLNNGRKLLLGRIDLWAVRMRNDNYLLASNGWTGRIAPVLVIRKVDVYLACNRSVPDASVARMNAAIAAMRQDGTMRRIERKYENATWKE